MNFFRKKDNESNTSNNVGEDMSQSVVEEKSPQPSARREPRILNSTQLGRVKDAKRLAEAKLQGLEESLNRLHDQQQWLRRYSETNMALEREKKRLFELGKQKATMARESDMLERYDLCEGIHATFQKLTVVKEQLGRDKRGLSLLEREAEENRSKTTSQEKRCRQTLDKLNNDNTNLSIVFDRVCSAFQLTGNSEAIESEMTFLSDYGKRIKEETDALTSLKDEKERFCRTLTDELERQCARRQSLEIHENMLRHGEAVLQRLSTMQDSDRLRSKLQQDLANATRRRNEENELLGKTFAQFQDILSKIETADAELNMHRSHIQGMDGLMLQERALMLKGRRQMLLSALSLWKRISTGYESIEERSKEVTTLRLHIGHLKDNVRQLEDEAGRVLRLSKEKEYTYLLSKGQDVIQLRAGLKEGQACPVCGQVHHPYHSDTMLDQSKLISEMKTDYELLASELAAKQQQLAEMRMELARAKGRLDVQEEALNAIRIRQNEDVQEWKLYAELDPTFSECSETTNLGARLTLLRQFIENVSRDATKAEEELETFTFHQSSIARYSEELQKLEQKKSEVSVRLGELNTGLQVFSREVEQTSSQLDAAAKQYTSIYENMQSAITIKDWFAIWQRTPEQLFEKIQKLITEWFALEDNIRQSRSALGEGKAELEGMLSRLQSLNRVALAISKRMELLSGLKAENANTFAQLIPNRDAKGLYQSHVQIVQSARSSHEDERQKMDDIRHEADIMQGRHDYYMAHIAQLEGEQKQLSEQLDLWMHAFNLKHPPVRFSELEDMFAEGKDWSKIRSSLKQINRDILLCQERVDDLTSRMTRLETEDGHCNPAQPDIQEKIAANWQTLMGQRSDTMMQIARLAVQLEDHERAVAAERNSAEPTSNLA